MAPLKLTYFDIHGGRGETARLALAIGGIGFEDDRVKYADWKARKSSTPFGAIPVLEVDGVAIAQSDGINRYVGKLAGLYPDDPLEQAFCDEVMGAIEDVSVAVRPTLGIKDPDELRDARERLTEKTLIPTLRALDSRLDARGGEWLAENRLTVADLKVMVWLKHIIGGGLDHVPSDLAMRVAPNLAAHYQKVKQIPRVQAYYESKGVELP